MTDKEKILDLLSRDNLSEDEKIIFDELIRSNSDLAEYQSFYKVVAELVSNVHPDSGMLSEYVLYQNNLSENADISRVIPKIENHLLSCEKCRFEHELFKEELTEIDKFVSLQLEDESDKNLPIENKMMVFLNQSYQRYAFAATILIAVIYFSLFTYSNFTTPGYMNFSASSELAEFSTSRGRTSDLFQKGVQSLSELDIENAIVNFEKDIEQNRNDKTVFYTYYLLGMVQLEYSVSTTLGLFKTYDDKMLSNSITNLLSSIEFNNSDSFMNIKFNSYYHLARAYLLGGNHEDALKYLRLVIENKGSYQYEAKEILNEVVTKL
ncbi:MAG: hypothetical protein KKA84_09145 [Bacteroidetes bacterium]|nr:hypothetical protein [Bacteroidota bacterium]